MSRRGRDLIGTTLALVVLFGAVISISDRLRESLARFIRDLSEPVSSPSLSAFGDAATGMVGVVGNFGADNPFLFAFLVVALVLVVLMLRS